MSGWYPFLAAMLVTGVFAGLLAGLLGVGGGIVVVPVLETALGFLGVEPGIRMHVAVGTSLAIIIPTSLAATLAHRRRGALDSEVARRWGGAVVVGAAFGAWLASRVDGGALAVAFAVLSLAIAAKMILQPETKSLTTSLPRTPWVQAIPASIGALGGLVGIGAAAFSVMAMRIFNRPIHTAIGTAAFFGLLIGVPASLGFVVAGYGEPGLPPGNLGYVNLVGLALIAPTTVLCAPLGARLAHRLPARTLTLLFAAFLVVASVRLLARHFA
jgi:uncharacterized membrane protein YfcA